MNRSSGQIHGSNELVIEKAEYFRVDDKLKKFYWYFGDLSDGRRQLFHTGQHGTGREVTAFLKRMDNALSSSDALALMMLGET